MVYTFELIKHSNIRYREGAVSLSRCELLAMLRALSLDCEVSVETLGGAVFLSFDCRELSPGELRYLSSHSSVSFMAVKESGSLLRPLSSGYVPYLPEDLPEILKYKGKTSVPFTRMMINTAAALTPYVFQEEPLSFFDPVCGKGTGCFCALLLGMNATGMDQDAKALREASAFFSRYLQYHKLKHEKRDHSVTSGKRSVPVTSFAFSDSREHFQAGDQRHLSFAAADTALSPVLFRRRPVHLIVADLPYGIQHAPRDGGKPESLRGFLDRVLPVWKSLMAPGAALALSFNTLTLPSSAVREALGRAGLRPLETDPYLTLKHEVEQAVVRDVVFACNNEEELKS
jgi:hypothetical protein